MVTTNKQLSVAIKQKTRAETCGFFIAFFQLHACETMVQTLGIQANQSPGEYCQW